MTGDLRRLTVVARPPCAVKRTGWEEYRDDGMVVVEYEGEDDRTYVACQGGGVRLWYIVEERRGRPRAAIKKR